ncbi:uncharacterized protein BHQ10_007088 [Talaromyces amestolkiae]|uniref:Transcription factor Iwr1 domain-containing protein n=1 Tax=Talaromyces amestolkiae TaxID=1196081 RepID=A0A364L5K1_TALAM|nr:uncharacterized protein BHQ10_007088 [Talaromyces amestolkiae]RAO71076.1 hypothetical protein BHQ10_007088 [Talaromyces amestolkiae]
MASNDRLLPPEQFHIKRRREEEPVDTLYIQSELHQKKRRFTDFVFQRVKVPGDSTTADSAGDAPSPPSSAVATAAVQDRLRSPRSVSTSDFPSSSRIRPAGTPAGISGIPTVRATSPGAEFRAERAQAESRRQEADAKRKRLQEPISKFLGVSDGLSDRENEKSATASKTGTPASPSSTPPLSASPAPFPTSLRRFHISRPSTPLSVATGSGVSKGNTPSRARAILVEKLTRAPSLRGVSVLETLEKTAGSSVEIDTVVQSQLAKTQTEDEVPIRRKRPIVNKAEKQWREQQKSTISAAKEHLTTKYEPQSDDLDKLAKELEEVMLDIEAEENRMDVYHKPPSAPAPAIVPQRQKGPLKYMPRNPGARRTVPTEASRMAEEQPDKTIHVAEAEMDSDGDYVYDTYIRVPIHTVASSVSGATPKSDIASYKDPLSEANTPGGISIDPTRTDIGVVVITSDDEDIWDQYLEEDQDSEVDWDGDDVDSNAEDNPANDYPDDELSSADEYDDNPSIYRRYRAANSDDEEFDVNEFDEEADDADYRKYMYEYVGDDDEE